MDPESVSDRTDLGAVAVSPDGERVAVIATERDPVAEECRQSVLVVPTDGSADPHRLTRADDAGGLAWGPDGRFLAVGMAREHDTELCVGRERADGDDEAFDDPQRQVWVYDLDRGGDPRQVTTFDHGVQGFDWGPGAERLVVAARDPTDDEQAYLDAREEGGPIETERLQHKYDGAGWLDTVDSYLFVVDRRSRETRRLDDAVAGGIFAARSGLEPAWHPSDDRIAFCAYHGDDADDTYERDLHVVDAGTGDTRRLTDGDVAVGAPAWSPDGRHVAVTSADPVNWYRPAEIAVVDVEAAGEDGDERLASLTAALDRTIPFRGHPVWLDESTVLTSVGDEGWTRLVECPLDGDPERVGAWQSRGESLGRYDADGGTVAGTFTRPADGFDLYAAPAAALDDDADPRERLTDVNRDLLDDHEWPACHRTTVDSDGTEVGALLYAPAAFDPDDPEPRPLVLRIHGGPMSYDEPAFDHLTAMLTARGYLVLCVNYRGSTSYGRAFCEALYGAWNGAEVDDLLAGADAAVERGWADPDRLFATGFSQGGVNTAYLLVASDRFAAGAAEHGIYDARAAFGTDDSHRWWEADFGLPWDDPEAYDRISSITDVDAIDTPLLLTAGGEDWRCPPTQAEQLHVSLKKRGVDSRLVVYPDEHHDVGDPDREVHRAETLIEWFERHDPGG